MAEKTRRPALSEQAPPDGPFDLTEVAAYLRGHPDAGWGRLSRFLARRQRLPRGEARQLARTITRKLETERAVEADADLWLLDLLGARPEGGAVALHNVEWECVTARALFHGVGPLLHATLSKAGWLDRLPASARLRLQRARAHTAEQNAGLMAEAERVLEAWAAAGIEPIALKGLALTPMLYRDLSLRPMGDIDLMVRPEEVEAAEAALSALGYRGSALDPTRRPPAFLREYGGSAEHCRRSGGMTWMLDLHWRLTNSEWIRRTVSLDLQDVWSASERWALGSCALRRLSPEYQLLHLALHLLKHKFGQGSFRQLVDIDRLWRLEGQRMVDAGLVSLAARARARVALYAVLWGCARWLGTRVPPEVLSALAPSRWRRRILARLLSGARGGFPTAEIRGWAKFLLQLLLLDEPQRAPWIGLKVLFPDARWLEARYGAKGRDVWRYRLSHPLSVILRGEL